MYTYDLVFDLIFMIFDFFRFKLGPLRNMRRKNPSRFPIPVKLLATSRLKRSERKNHFSAPSKSNCAHTLV